MSKEQNNLYQFKVQLTTQENRPGHYKMNVYYQGDHDFYNRLIATSQEENALLTCKPLSFVMKVLWQQKYLFYFEQGKGKPSRYTQWELEKILRNEIEDVQVERTEDIPGMERGIADQLDFFANEERKKKKM